MTTATKTQPTLWDASDRRHQAQVPRPVPTPCALCTEEAPVTSLGLCRSCLASAAAEYAVIAAAADRRPSSVQARDLCTRCGSARHPTSRCPH